MLRGENGSQKMGIAVAILLFENRRNPREREAANGNLPPLSKARGETRTVRDGHRKEGGDKFNTVIGKFIIK